MAEYYALLYNDYILSTLEIGFGYYFVLLIFIFCQVYRFQIHYDHYSENLD